MVRSYKVGEIAELTKVSVRTLHHYDQIGILRPATISDGGHRLYTETELLRLQQILTLRYLGFQLREIGELLDRQDFDLLASLRIQQRAVRDHISELEQVEAALTRMVDHRQSTGAWDWNLTVEASRSVQRQREEARHNMEKYYTPEQMKQFEELGEAVGPDVIKSVEDRWTALMVEVRANQHLDPASPEARNLADRWNAMTEETMSYYRDHPELVQAMRENYAKGVFEQTEHAPHAADLAFIQRVNEAREP